MTGKPGKPNWQVGTSVSVSGDSGVSSVHIPSYPSYPTNGGKLDSRTPAKVGEWVWTPKIDDWHGVIDAAERRIWNQQGAVSSIEHKFDVAMLTLHAFFLRQKALRWLDVGLMERRHNLMRGCIIIFDLIPVDMPETLYSERRALLEAHFEVLPMVSDLVTLKLGQPGPLASDRVFLIPQYVCRPGEEIVLYRTLEVQNAALGHKFYEGLVAKRADKPYPIQLRGPKEPTPWMIKHRFDQ